MPRALLLVVLSAALTAADPYTKHPLGSTPAPYGYLQHLPPKMAKGKHYPLVFFLHGLGELGDSSTQLDAVAKNGPFRHLAKNDAIAKRIDQEGAILIGPQGIKADKWWQTPKLIQTLDHVCQTLPVDPDRVYVTGLSMGGGGTWALITAKAPMIAAAIPVCPAAKAGKVDPIKDLPIWAHHAIGDGVVKFPENTQGWFDALLAARGAKPAGGVLDGYTRNDQPQFASLLASGWAWQSGTSPTPATASTLMLTVYPDQSHDSWGRAYSNPIVWDWLFAQKRR